MIDTNRRHFFASIPFLAALPKLFGGEKAAKWPPDIESMSARFESHGVRILKIRGFSDGDQIWANTGFVGDEIITVEVVGLFPNVDVGDVQGFPSVGMPEQMHSGKYGICGKSFDLKTGITTFNLVPLSRPRYAFGSLKYRP